MQLVMATICDTAVALCRLHGLHTQICEVNSSRCDIRGQFSRLLQSPNKWFDILFDAAFDTLVFIGKIP